jgi:hypothetical protein
MGEARARGQHQRVAERAGKPGLVAVGECVAAHVHEHQEVAAEALSGQAEALGQRGRTLVHVHEHRRLAEELGHPGLREAHAARLDARLRTREQHPGGEPLRSGDLVAAPRPGQRVDRPPLPGHAAHYRLGARVEPAGLARGERADHVAATADADAERAARVAEEALGVHQPAAPAIDSG